jgi:S1-C subfamily serine protease
VRPGNSGGPMVDAGGRVLSTIFAATVGGGTPGGYGVADETVASILATARARASGNAVVGTGPCTGG